MVTNTSDLCRHAPRSAQANGRGGLILLCIVAVGYIALPASADEGVVRMGEARFMERCSICHGLDAEGAGPFAAMLIVEPPDLTGLARSNGGVFPFGRVYDAIDGREIIGAHGARSMPIWGREWAEPEYLGGETLARGKIVEIIIYLRSIQR